MPPPEIRPLAADSASIDALASLLIETVAGGGSVGFMHPVAPDKARAFARASLDAAARGERLVLGAFVDGVLASTVTLQLALPENQPHRAEIAKMMTAPAFRGRGLARALLSEVERQAVARGRTMLVLDTAEEDGAAGLYEKHGFLPAGRLPDYALKPHGGLTATLLYVKRIG